MEQRAGTSQVNRVDYLDYCKALGIIGMIIGHIGLNVQFPSGITHFITAWHMPIFFIISGFLFDTSLSKKFGHFVNRKALTLLVPYLIYGLFSWIMYIGFNFLAESDNMEKAIKSVYYVFTYNTVFFPISGALWFLTAMFFAQIIYYLLLKLCKNNLCVVGVITVGVAIIMWLFSQKCEIRLVWGLDCALCCLIFLWGGSMLKEAMNRLDKIKLPILGACGVISIVLIYCNEEVNVRTLKYGNPILFYLNALSFSGFLVLFLKHVSVEKKCSVLLRIGKNSIVYMIFNQLILAFVYRIFDKICPDIAWWLETLISFIIVVCGCAVLTWFINKYLAFTIGKRY